MTDGPVLYRRHDGIVTLTLNRPETLNAMNEAMMGEMERILIELEADTGVRAVVLTGAGRAFSSGGDQKRDRSGEGQQPLFDGDLGGALIERLNRCVLRMQGLPKPIVGSINGVAAGAGLNIALATDLRIAADTALPPPRFHLLRFHGLLAPHARLRAQVVPRPSQTAELSAGPPAQGLAPPPGPSSPAAGPGSLSWAALMARVFAIDVLRCSRCGGRRHLVAVHPAGQRLRHLLERLGLGQPPTTGGP